MKPEAFIFDLDGVLADTASFHYHAWKKIADELDIGFDENDNESLKGVDRANSLLWILNKGDKKISSPEFDKLLDRKNTYYLESIKELNSSDLYKGVGELFENLYQKGILIGLASASKNAINVVKSLGIYEKFDYIADSNFISNNKPDPEIFFNAAEGLNLSVYQCVGIEDARSGIEAINSAKMFSIGIGKVSYLTEANLVFDNINQLSLELIFDRFISNAGVSNN